MYERFYGLTADPFRLLPDPDVCFPHQSCAKAWAYLRYAIKRGEGIVVVTGPPGTGKTTLGERLINELDPSKIVSVRLVARDLNATELLRRIAYAFGMAAEHMDPAMLTYQIEHYLAELERKDGSTVVLVVDEAQTLSGKALEALRVLTDLQSPRSRPLLQLFLLGQEELEDIIGASDMEQFRQRVIASCRLHTMDLPETKAYLEYRLQRVGWRGDPSIDGAAVHAIFRHSGGLPRHVNKICSRLMLYGCAEEKHRLEESDVLAVVRDLTDELLTPAQPAPDTQATATPAPFASLDELALVIIEDLKADAPTEPAQAQTLDLSETSREADLPPDAEADQAGQPQQDHDGSYLPHRRHLRSHSHHLLHSLRHRLRALPGRLKHLEARLRAAIIPAAATSIGHIRRFTGKLVGAAAAAKPRLSEWRRRLSTIVDNRPLQRQSALIALPIVVVARWRPICRIQRQSALIALPIVGLLAGGLLLWGIQGGEREGIDRLDVAKQQLLPPSVSRITQSAHADVFRRWGGDRSSDPYFTSTTIPAAQLIPRDAAVPNDIRHPPPDNNAPTPEGVSLAQRTAKLPWILDVAGSGLTPQAMGGVPGLVLTSAPQRTTANASGETRKPTDPIVQKVAYSHSPPTLGTTTADLSSTSIAERPIASAERAIATPNEDDFTRLLPPTGAGNPSPEPALEATESAVTFEPAIQAASVTAPGIEDLPVASSDAEDSGQAQIEQLLRLADTAIEHNRLLIPEATSAYHYLQQVLALDPDNSQAHAGLERVVQRYNDKARKALASQDYKLARRFVSRALRVDRRSAEARALRAKIEAAEARAQKEREEALAALEAARKAELERMAAEAKAAEPVAAKAPPRDSGSGFERIMKLLDGV